MIKGYSILNGVKCFSREDGTQEYLVFQPALKYFNLYTNNMVLKYKSLGLSDKNFKPLTATDNARLDYLNNSKFRIFIIIFWVYFH